MDSFQGPNVDTFIGTGSAESLDLVPVSKVVKQLPNQILEAMRIKVLEVKRVEGSRWLSLLGHDGHSNRGTCVRSLGAPR